MVDLRFVSAGRLVYSRADYGSARTFRAHPLPQKTLPDSAVPRPGLPRIGLSA